MVGFRGVVVVIEVSINNKEEYTVLWPSTLTGARMAFICIYSGTIFMFWKYHGIRLANKQTAIYLFPSFIYLY